MLATSWRFYILYWSFSKRDLSQSYVGFKISTDFNNEINKTNLFFLFLFDKLSSAIQKIFFIIKFTDSKQLRLFCIHKKTFLLFQTRWREKLNFEKKNSAFEAFENNPSFFGSQPFKKKKKWFISLKIQNN